IELLPEFGEALAQNETQAKAAEGSTDDLAGATGDLGSQADAAAGEIQTLVDAMREQRAESVRAANAEINYHAALDDARQAMKENGRTLDVTTEKGRANRSALIELADSWNGLSDEQKNAKGSAKAARDEFVRIATQMGMT